MNENTQFIINNEYAELTPPLPTEQFESLKLSIRESGVFQPITINQKGIILDGHNRYRACRELGIGCPYQTIDLNDDPLLEQLFIIETNCSRRQLSKFQSIEMQVRAEPIRSKLASKRRSEGLKQVSKNLPAFNSSISENLSLVPFGTDGEKGRVIDICAKRANVSPNTYYRAREVSRSGNEEIIQKARTNVLSINAAFKLIHKKKLKIKPEHDCNAIMTKQAENPVWVSKNSNQKIFNTDFLNSIRTFPDPNLGLLISIFPESEPFQHKKYFEIMKFAKRAVPRHRFVIIGCSYSEVGNAIALGIKAGLQFRWQYPLPRYGPKNEPLRLFSRSMPLLLFSPAEGSHFGVLATRRKSHGPMESDDEQLEEKPVQRGVRALANLITYLIPPEEFVLDPLLTDSLTVLAATDEQYKFRGYLRRDKDLKRITEAIASYQEDAIAGY